MVVWEPRINSVNVVGNHCKVTALLVNVGALA